MAISAESLAALKSLEKSETEGAGALVATVRAELDALDAKAFTVIGEKRTETARKQALETALVEVAKQLGIDGVDVETVLKDVSDKARSVVAERDAAKSSATELETKAAEAAGKLEAAETKSKREEYAAVAKVDPVIFADLFNAEDLKKFSVVDGAVLYDEKPLREQVQADDRLKRYEAALFQTPTKSASNTPPGATPPPPANPVLAYIKKSY